MPIYEYRCDRCDQTIEVIQKFSDAPLTTHDNCGGALEKLLSSSALQFKGSGWYVTDYAKKNGGAPKGKGESKTESKAESKSESTSGSGDSAKSESKPTPAKSDTSASKSDSK